MAIRKRASFVRQLYHKEVAKQLLRHTHKYGKEVMVDGKIFPSMNKAANFIGRCGSNLKRNLEKGNNKINGYDVSYVKEDKVRGKKAPVMVEINGRVFGSLKSAAGFMNIYTSCLSIQLQNGVTSYLGFDIGYANGN